MSNRASAIEIEYLNCVICTNKSHFSEDDISDLCEGFFFIDRDEPDILNTRFFKKNKDSAFVSFAYVGRRSRVFFYEVTSFGIDNGSRLEKYITRINERLVVVNIWYDTDPMTILTEEMGDLRIIKYRRSVSLSIQSEKPRVVDRAINFIEITAIDESSVFFCTIV